MVVHHKEELVTRLSMFWMHTVALQLIIERSDKDKDIFQDHESIRADMDIMDHNLLALRNVRQYPKKCLKGKINLRHKMLLKTERIIEAIIGLANTYKLFITTQLYC